MRIINDFRLDKSENIFIKVLVLMFFLTISPIFSFYENGVFACPSRKLFNFFMISTLLKLIHYHYFFRAHCILIHRLFELVCIKIWEQFLLKIIMIFVTVKASYTNITVIVKVIYANLISVSQFT